jgi:hypothetical protein
MFDQRSFFVTHFLPPVLKKVIVKNLLRRVVVLQHFGIESSHLNTLQSEESITSHNVFYPNYPTFVSDELTSSLLTLSLTCSPEKKWKIFSGF